MGSILILGAPKMTKRAPTCCFTVFAWTGVLPSLEPDPEMEMAKGQVKAETHANAARPPGGQKDKPGRKFSGSSSMASFFLVTEGGCESRPTSLFKNMQA